MEVIVFVVVVMVVVVVIVVVVVGVFIKITKSWIVFNIWLLIWDWFDNIDCMNACIDCMDACIACMDACIDCIVCMEAIMYCMDACVSVNINRFYSTDLEIIERSTLYLLIEQLRSIIKMSSNWK